MNPSVVLTIAQLHMDAEMYELKAARAPTSTSAAAYLRMARSSRCAAGALWVAEHAAP